MTASGRTYLHTARALVEEWRIQGEKYEPPTDDGAELTLWRQRFIDHLVEAHLTINDMVLCRATLAEAQHAATVLAALGWCALDMLQRARQERA